MKNLNIKQSVIVKGLPGEIYNIFLTSKDHAAFTGDKAIISIKVGGKFNVFGGYASGKNLELIEGKKIVQSWEAKDGDWPGGHTSEIELLFKKFGKDKTEISFTHRNVPESAYKNIKSGWQDYYWKPLKEYCKQKFGK